MKFENRVAVVTGGAGRIGRALASQLLASGVKVALVDIQKDRLNQVCTELGGESAGILPFVMDVRSSKSVQSAAAEILAAFGKVDILVNNAGVWTLSLFTDMTDELWDTMIDLNLTGVYRVTKAFLPSMLENGYGRIINLGSIAGEVGLPKFSAYAASKGGVIMLTKTLAMELAHKNITVNSVSPGMIADEPSQTPCTWIGRCGTGDEVANVIMLLASDDASFITGVDYTVDGGRILGPHGTGL